MCSADISPLSWEWVPDLQNTFAETLKKFKNGRESELSKVSTQRCILSRQI
jgi:hypothetical protein